MLRYLNAYLRDSKIEGISPNTLDARRKDIKHFFNWCETDDVEEIDRNLVKDYIYACQERNLKAGTINTRLQIIRGFFNWLVEEEIIKRNPTDKIKNVKKEITVIKPYNVGEIKSMLDFYRGKRFQDVRNKTIITLFAETGIRNAELCHIKLGDIYENEIRIKGKGNKERFVPISEVLHKQLFRYQLVREKQLHSDDCPYLFFSNRGTMISYTVTRNVLRKACEAIGLDARILTHNFRRFYATSMLDHVDLFTVSKLLGHTEISTTQRYVEGTEQRVILERGRKHSPLS
ncbi:tyrosine-type recombinase/integrase [Arthrobacter citreus]|nr:tyrosine-type recombinase/integrase [Arthrobacter citreus]